MKPFVALLLLGITGCASQRMVQLTPDTYLISRSSAAGMFADMPKLKAEVIQQAQTFAASQGKRAEPVHMNETFPAHGFPSFDYEFRLVPKIMAKESN